MCIFVADSSAMTENEKTQLHLQELLAVGNEYCHFIENIERYDDAHILEYMRKMLPLLYVKGCLFPPPDECDESYMQRYVTEETYESIFNEIRNKLKPNDEFYVFDSEMAEPVKKSIAECLTDIYQDLKDVLVAYLKGLEPERICAEFYLHQWFALRWGSHISLLMPVLHAGYEKLIAGAQSGTEFD